MNVFIGGVGACSVHNEKYILIMAFMDNGYTITDDYTEADLIVLTDMCIGSRNNMFITLEYLADVLKQKKENAEVILSGCLSKEFKFELPSELQNILEQVRIIPPDKLIKSFFDELGFYNNKYQQQESFLPIVKLNNHGVRISPVLGCLNSCSFCKTHYMNFDLKSFPLYTLESEFKSIENCSFINYASICSSNFSLYGVDLYGEQLAHKVIRLFNDNENIKYINIGAIINWYPELIKEILDNPKVKQIDSSLETGSPRLYNLMNRPISLEKWIETIKTIRENRPDILISTEVISGFPTETVDDVKMTLDLIQELRLYNNHIYPYRNFEKIPSSKLPQHSIQYNILSGMYLQDRLKTLNSEIEDEIEYGEMYVLDKYSKQNCYKVLLIDGTEKPVNFECFDKEYEVGDFVTKGNVKNKTYAKRLQKK